MPLGGLSHVAVDFRQGRLANLSPSKLFWIGSCTLALCVLGRGGKNQRVAESRPGAPGWRFCHRHPSVYNHLAFALTRVVLGGFAISICLDEIGDILGREAPQNPIPVAFFLVDGHSRACNNHSQLRACGLCFFVACCRRQAAVATCWRPGKMRSYIPKGGTDRDGRGWGHV